MTKTIKINGVDFTDFFTPTGLTVSYKKVRGNNADNMLDGTYTDDVLKIRTVAAGTCMPLNEEQLSAFLSEVLSQYVTLYFFDPAENGYREMECIPSEPSQKHRGEGSNGLDYWTGTVMQFEER